MAETAQWYVIHTYSGYENKVATSIEKVVDLRGLHDLICEVKIPMEKVQDVKESGEVVETERKLLPGYVLVNMVVNDDTWVLLRNIRGVTGFVGPEGKPIPLTDEEIRNLNLVQSVEEAPFNAGDNVKVVSGPMENFTGIVESVDMKERKARVIISMGGRDIPAEIGIGDLAAL